MQVHSIGKSHLTCIAFLRAAEAPDVLPETLMFCGRSGGLCARFC